MLNHPTKIHLITTGGTIEKTYDEAEGTLENRDSVLNHWLSTYLRLPYTQICVHSLLNKDSLFMTEDDRELIAQTVGDLQENGQPIVVSHGTDTMALSAEGCQRTITRVKVPVVFTGAMKPLGFLDSDAVQNITEALIAAQILSPGVYLSFHNRIFPAGQVRKNAQRKTFEAA